MAGTAPLASPVWRNRQPAVEKIDAGPDRGCAAVTSAGRRCPLPLTTGRIVRHTSAREVDRDTQEDGMQMLVAGLALFLGTHAVSRLGGLKAAIQGRIGAQGYKGLYSLVSLAGFVLLVMGYGAYRAAGPIPVWTPPAWMSHLAFLLMLPAFVSLVAAYAPRGAIKAATLHPMLLSVKIWALAHLLANGDLGSILLFGGFLGWAVYSRVGQPKEPRERLPFGMGDWAAIGIGTVAWLVFALWLHPMLIGVSVMPM
jgi:uncharacterized membrane protein